MLSLIGRRADLLGAIVGKPAPKRDLVDELDVSRSTVDRAVRELEAADLIERTNGEIAITMVGRLSFASYLKHGREIARVMEFSDVLEHLDSSAPLPHWFLLGSDLYRPEPPDVHRAHTRAKSELEGADRIEGLTMAVTDPAVVDRFVTGVRDGTLEAELVMAGEVIEHLLETEGRHLKRPLEDGGLALYEYDEIPFGMLVTDPNSPDARVLLFVYEDGYLVGVLRNRRRQAVDWARSLVRGIRDDAEPVEDVTV